MNLAQTQNYGRERLNALNLTHAEGFTYTSPGNIDIQYYTLSGDRLYPSLNPINLLSLSKQILHLGATW